MPPRLRTAARRLSAGASQYAAYAALRLLLAAVQAAPLSFCQRGTSGLAWLFDRGLGLRRRVVEENLAIALPDADPAERRRLARAMWRHLFLMVAEIAHTPRRLHRTTWRRYVDLDGDDTVVRTMLRDGPKVIISAHYGNFELGGYLLGLFGFPTHTIARTLDNPHLDRFVNRFRGRTGQHILPRAAAATKSNGCWERAGCSRC